MLILLLFPVVLSYINLIIYTDLSMKAFPKFQNWSVVDMKEDHSDRQPNQQPSEWTNVTLNIPEMIYMLQLTANTSSSITEEIPYIGIDYLGEVIDVSVTWWGQPWKLYVGWY